MFLTDWSRNQRSSQQYGQHGTNRQSEKLFYQWALFIVGCPSVSNVEDLK